MKVTTCPPRPKSSLLRSMPNSTMSSLRLPSGMGKQNDMFSKKALRFYLHNVVPSQQLVRPHVMDAFEQSVARNHDLLQRLAK